MEVALFGEETIVQLKRMGEVEDSVVGPGRDLDGKRGIQPRNREFKNTPQEIIAVVRQLNHEGLLEGIVPFHRGFHLEGLEARK